MASMSGLNHSFLLLEDVGDRRRTQYAKHLNDPRAVLLHDDVVGYFWDSLCWIPTANPGMPGCPKGFGLNRWGPTSISGKGALVAASVFRAWATLLDNGPSSLVLTGPWTMTVGKPKSGHYAKLQVNRRQLVTTCRSIAALADQASVKGFWLLHEGI
ncbi:MAG: hypothetical protein QM765_29060 [Myxococcales bacterium]